MRLRKKLLWGLVALTAAGLLAWTLMPALVSVSGHRAGSTGTMLCGVRPALVKVTPAPTGIRTTGALKALSSIFT